MIKAMKFLKISNIILILFLFSISGCNRAGVPEIPPPAYSLLYAAPDAGLGDIRHKFDGAPTRMLKNLDSVEGWLIPPEKVLSFPVDLRESARLSVRLGLDARISVRLNDITIRIIYIPEEFPDAEPAIESRPYIIFESADQQLPEFFQRWYSLDVGLEGFAPGKGELRFMVDGPLAGDPGVDVMFGAPWIYHQAERAHKNVILIGIDTLRRDSVGVYGGREGITPNIDEWAHSGTIFEQNRSQAPWTLPSFSSMITGMLPSQINATIYTGFLPPDETTIGELIRPYGYTTYTICSNTWLGNDESGFEQGMDGLWFKYDCKAPESVDRAIDFIERNRDRDWFLFLHMLDPHIPYAPPAEFAEKFIDPDYETDMGFEFNNNEVWMSGTFTPPEDELNYVRALYDAEASNVDFGLTMLFAYLESKELMDDTLIIFVSDHGEEFFDHGGFDHGHTQFDELVHMPLMISGPGFNTGERVEAPVGNFDIAPTILNFLNVPIPEDFIGRPLQDYAAGNPETGRLIYGEDNTRGTLRRYAVDWPYKCIVDFVNFNTLLFNLEDDPGEQTDISSEEPDITRRLADSIIHTMRSSDTAFHIWITRGFNDDVHRFTGTITVPGGIDLVRSFRLKDIDHYEIDGNTVTFDIYSAEERLGPNKHLLIIPSIDSETMEVTIQVDGEETSDRFFPYGTMTPEPSNHAIVNLGDFPLGADLPISPEQNPSACYLWGTRSFNTMEALGNNPETLEQLRALGYIN